METENQNWAAKVQIVIEFNKQKNNFINAYTKKLKSKWYFP